MAEIPEWLKQEFHPDYPKYVNVETDERGNEIVNGTFMPSLKVKKLGVNTATAYHFVFDEPFGWAIFSINDATGEFNIQSDWGDWQHRWNINHLGDSYTKHTMPLTSFLGDRGDAGYVCDKLHYGKERNQFSPEKTEESIKEHILLERKSLNIDKDEARELWEQASELDYDSADAFYYSLRDYPELNNFLCEPWEFLRTEYTSGYKFLHYKLLPFFFQYLRREVLRIEDQGGNRIIPGPKGI